ncbi:MAG: type IX secretion system sortase PorU [Muribaculaceae bacterium]|nr:type IX secretion system sortase PorU [Muribaculaceae bacterium]
MQLSSYLSHLRRRVIIVLAAVFVSLTAGAFSPDSYPQTSPLASGKWVKVAVSESGLYRVDAASLRSMGFSDASRVRVYGQGGGRLSDILDKQTAQDYMFVNHSEALPDGSLVFYGYGPEHWEVSTGTRYHSEMNPYASEGYYLLTEAGGADADLPAPMAYGEDSRNPVETAFCRLQHEKNTVQATEVGPLFLGEDMMRTPQRDFEFRTPGRLQGSDVWIETQIAHFHTGARANLEFYINGNKDIVQSTDVVPATTVSNYVYGSMTTTRRTVRPATLDKFTVTVKYIPEVTPKWANLDYVTVNYTRELKLEAGDSFMFWSNQPSLGLTAPADARVWCVDQYSPVRSVETRYADGVHVFRPSDGVLHGYVAWTPSSSFMVPRVVGDVANQDLHAQVMAEPAEMLIITPSLYRESAERIAALHRDVQGMAVRVVDCKDIYNEYGAGNPDVSVLRRYLKHVYDVQGAGETPLRYVLLMGRATMDGAERLADTSAQGYVQLPWWVVRQARLSMTSNDGFGTDDFIAMLEDNAGSDLGLDHLSVAVGRIPVLTPDEGLTIADKLTGYMTQAKKTGWKNRVVILADDEDRGVHLHQAEELIRYLEETPGMQHLVDKVYIDAYEKTGGTYPAARQEMFRALDEGAAWWLYTGHANNHSWTGEAMLTYSDINSMYFRNLPFVLASTCDFLRWDCETVSGGEIMFKERYGGAVGMISATRPVYISDNAYFLNAFGRACAARDENGSFGTPGDVYRNLKNDIRDIKGKRVSNANRLRFVFMGDPAVPMVTPDNIVRVETIDGKPVDGNDQIIIGALGRPVIEGVVTDPAGNVLTGFNGVVTVDIFDALQSVTTLAHGNGIEDTFDRHGDRLYSGSARVTDGHFSLVAAMPSLVADNFRPATMSLYAYDLGSSAEAVGLNKDFYVFGFDEPETPDTTVPVIESFVLNHAGFTSGDQVNFNPMVIARVSDDLGLNLSTAGVGHNMTLTLDERTTFSDVSSFFIPDANGNPSGVINYSLSDLTEGYHQLRLRVFDTSGNMSEQTIEFYACENLSPQIFDVYTDASPARTTANFYVKHDRPENITEVLVTVYNLMGTPLWSGSAKGMSDGDVSAPVTWNLNDNSGRRVPRGIYLYRASITTDNQTFETASRRIAVAAE